MLLSVLYHAGKLFGKVTGAVYPRNSSRDLDFSKTHASIGGSLIFWSLLYLRMDIIDWARERARMMFLHLRTIV